MKEGEHEVDWYRGLPGRVEHILMMVDGKDQFRFPVQCTCNASFLESVIVASSCWLQYIHGIGNIMLFCELDVNVGRLILCHDQEG